MEKKLLIIGGASLVGSTIIDYATDDYEIFTTETGKSPSKYRLKPSY